MKQLGWACSPPVTLATQHFWPLFPSVQGELGCVAVQGELGCCGGRPALVWLRPVGLDQEECRSEGSAGWGPSPAGTWLPQAPSPSPQSGCVPAAAHLE